MFKAFENGEEVTKKQLIINDYYCLKKTFERVQSLLHENIPKESFFNFMATELQDLTVPLSTKLPKF